MLSTIIRNLISNAIKYTEPGGKITIGYENSPIEVTFWVEDTGIGIPEQHIPLIFDTFANFSTPGTNYEKGTGLGLILCKEFVETQGGKISVESTPGIGSRFKFTIPTPTSFYSN
jgi:signal transduction histidine kinase